VQRFIQSIYLKLISWWLFWTAMGSWLIYQFGFSWSVALADAAITQADWTLAGYAISLIVQNYRPSAKNILNLHFATMALAALFTFVALPWLLPSAVPATAGYEDFLQQSLPVRFVIAWMQIIFVAAISWVGYFLQEQQENKKREADAERLVKEAELTQLRQQLQPHFLFNSLNSINALMGSQPEQARHMVQQLSDFLRGTIKKDDRQRVTLEEEIRHLGLYLDIEKVRFGYRLHANLKIAEESKQLLLPPLILQPIVENAIKFGLYDTIGEITIALQAKAEENFLCVQVTNPFDPATAQPRQGTGFGLASIARRLYLIYSQNNLLQTSSENNLFITTIRIPQYDQSAAD
jgi:hypothetical protein